jgi:hypothetical protein
MPLTDLREPIKQTASGSCFFASDAETNGRVMITVSTSVIDYHRDSVPPPDGERFRTFIVGVASNLYDAGPKDGYVIIDMEALELS